MHFDGRQTQRPLGGSPISSGYVGSGFHRFATSVSSRSGGLTVEGDDRGQQQLRDRSSVRRIAAPPQCSRCGGERELGARRRATGHAAQQQSKCMEATNAIGRLVEFVWNLSGRTPVPCRGNGPRWIASSAPKPFASVASRRGVRPAPTCLPPGRMPLPDRARTAGGGRTDRSPGTLGSAPRGLRAGRPGPHQPNGRAGGGASVAPNPGKPAIAFLCQARLARSGHRAHQHVGP